MPEKRCNCSKCNEKRAAYQRQYYLIHPAYAEAMRARKRNKKYPLKPPNTRKSLPIA